MQARRRTRSPYAMVARKGENETEWTIHWHTGKVYRAIVRHADGSIHLLTGAKRLPVATATADKIEPDARKAIMVAEAKSKG